MSDYNVLGKLISVTLAASSYFLAAPSFSQDSSVCDTDPTRGCVVTGTAPPDPVPPPLPPDEPPSQGGGYSGGSGGSPANPSPPPARPVECLTLFNNPVDGCDRQTAYSGTPRVLLPNYGEYIYRDGATGWGWLPADSFWRSTHPWIEDEIAGVTYELSACYADPSIDPSACEDAFLYGMSSRVGPLVIGAHRQGIPALTPAEVFAEHQSQLWGRVWSSRFERSNWSPLQYFSFSGSLGNLGFSVPVPPSLTFGQFNILMREARMQRACYFWMQAWDGLGCSS